MMGFYCAVGGHTVNFSDGDPTGIPANWAWVKASVIPAPKGPEDQWEPGIWYEDDNAEAEVLCCPSHRVLIVRINN